MENRAAVSFVDPVQFVNRFAAKGMKTMNFRSRSPRMTNDENVNALKRNLEQRSIRLKLKQRMKVEQALRELQMESDTNYMPSDLEPAIEPITAIPPIPEYKCIDVEYLSVRGFSSSPKVSSPSRIKVNNDRLEERVAGVQKLLQDQNLLALKSTSVAPNKTKDICKEFCDEQLMKEKNQRLQQGKEYIVNKKKKQAELKAQQEHEIKLKKLQQKKRITELYRVSDAKLRASVQQPKPSSIETAVKSRSTSAPGKSNVSMDAPLDFDDVIIKPQSPVHRHNAPSECENSAPDKVNIWRSSENLKNIHVRIQENMASIIPARMPTSTESLKKPTSSPLNDSGHSNNSFTSNCSAKSRHSNTSNRSKTHHINGDIHIDESKILLQQNRNRLKINKVLDRCSRVNDMLTRISLELRKSQKTKLELEETLAKSITGGHVSVDSKTDYSSNKKEIMVLTNLKLPDSRSFIISPPRKKVTFSAKISSSKQHRPRSRKATRNHIALSRRQYKATMVKAFLSTLAPQQLRQMKAAKKKN